MELKHTAGPNCKLCKLIEDSRVAAYEFMKTTMPKQGSTVPKEVLEGVMFKHQVVASHLLATVMFNAKKNSKDYDETDAMIKIVQGVGIELAFLEEQDRAGNVEYRSGKVEQKLPDGHH